MKLYYSRNLNPRVALAVARHLNAPVEFVRASPRAPGQHEKYLAPNPNALALLPFAAESKLPLAGYRHLQAWNDRLNALPGWAQPLDGLD